MALRGVYNYTGSLDDPVFLSFLDGFVMETKIVQMGVMNSIVGKKQSMKKTSVL